MENLHQNWITEKHTDFEYKKYVLLAFLKNTKEELEAQRLYPAVVYLREQYEYLIGLKASFELLESKLSKNIKSIDIHNYKIVYQSIFEDDKMIQDINNIIQFSIPLIEKQLYKANQIISNVEQHIDITPVGLTPLICKEGYLLLNTAHQMQTKVYTYQLTFYENSKVNYRGINTQFIGDFKKSISSTFEFIKLDLIRNNKNLPNPATYLVATEMTLPIEFTFLPVAKMKLAKLIN
jgi:hypothetical protein